MGTGKSSAAITYINEHPDERFIYITPYLDEAERIKDSCPCAYFVEPSNKIPEYHFRKVEHTASLIKSKRNIATTHQAFSGYTREMLDDIVNAGYVLIIDESVEFLESCPVHPTDLKMAVDLGYISEVNGTYALARDDYDGVMMRDLFSTIKTKNLMKTRAPGDSSDELFYWVLPQELICAFKDVFILTYLFEAQSIHHFLEMYRIPYSYIGVSQSADGVFRFDNNNTYKPENTILLKDKIHILENYKLNAVGDDYYALSASWFDREAEGIERLRKNILNYFRNIHSDMPADKRLWGSYKDAYYKLRGKGYANSFLQFNARATNAYRDKVCLAYCVNVFMNVGEKIFCQKNGVEIDDDKYALSVMVQWIWRSAIRDGGEISIYLPSSRMRSLLIDWINSFAEGGIKT